MQLEFHPMCISVLFWSHTIIWIHPMCISILVFSHKIMQLEFHPMCISNIFFSHTIIWIHPICVWILVFPTQSFNLNFILLLSFCLNQVNHCYGIKIESLYSLPEAYIWRCCPSCTVGQGRQRSVMHSLDELWMLGNIKMQL